MSETFLIKVEVDTATKLPGRRCNRCNGVQFRPILFLMDNYTARCANCIFHHITEPCGTVVDFSIGETTTVRKCGDVFPTGFGTDDSPSTIPLAICIECHKIVPLQ